MMHPKLANRIVLGMYYLYICIQIACRRLHNMFSLQSTFAYAFFSFFKRVVWCRVHLASIFQANHLRKIIQIDNQLLLLFFRYGSRILIGSYLFFFPMNSNRTKTPSAHSTELFDADDMFPM